MYKKLLLIGIISASTVVTFHSAVQANEVTQAKGKLRHLSESHMMLSNSARQNQIAGTQNTGKLGSLFDTHVCLNNPRPDCGNPMQTTKMQEGEVSARLKAI